MGILRSIAKPFEQELAEGLKEAVAHLDYCGYGDNWERECATYSKLPERLDALLQKAREKGLINE
jgi:hypothetical protein